jgi:hypothetical protein
MIKTASLACMINEGNWEHHYVMLTTLRGPPKEFFLASVHCSCSARAELQAQQQINIHPSTPTGV